MFKMVKSHWKHWQNMQKLYCGRGLTPLFFLPQKYMGSNMQGQVGAGRGRPPLGPHRAPLLEDRPSGPVANPGLPLGPNNVIQYSTVLEKLGIIYTQTHFACIHYHKWPRIFEICDRTQQTHFPCKHYHK